MLAVDYFIAMNCKHDECFCSNRSASRRKKTVAKRALIRIAGTIGFGLALLASLAQAQKTYDPGAGDTEIKIGNISPYSGWANDHGAVGPAEAAYFQMINDRGGVNGRKINFISEDMDSRPVKSMELARKLTERGGVLLIFSSFGTEGNLSIRDYMNEKKVPQLFIQSSSAVFDDPANFPWTMGFFATYKMEGLVYAKYILRNKPDAKIAVLDANDDAGKEYLAGLREGLGGKPTGMIVKQASYETSDTELNSQMAALKNSGVDVLFNFCVGSFTTRAIREAYDIGWHPMQFIPNASLSVAAFLDPVGLEKAAGIISNARSKGWSQPKSRDDSAVREFLEWGTNYDPQASLRDQSIVAGYERAEVLVEVLKKSGDNLTRANVMKQAANVDMEPGMFRSGIRIKTSPTDYQPVKQLFLIKFDGKEWTAVGPITRE
jgi:branched-chain amino acid transport system substrate-binding protein